MPPAQFPRQCLPIWVQVPQPTPPPPVPDVIFIRQDPVPRIRNPVPRPIPYDGPALHTRGAVRRMAEVEMLVEPVVMPVEPVVMLVEPVVMLVEPVVMLIEPP